MCAYAGGGQPSASAVIPQELPSLLYDRLSYWSWAHQLGWMTIKPQGSPISASLTLGLPMHATILTKHFLYGFRGPNLGLRASLASTLPAELFS